MATVKVNSSNFQAEVLNADVPVVVDFWAEWCGPCKMIGPSLEELSGELAGKVKIVKLMTFGAFAEIIPGVDGLIHISQIADRRIGKPEDVLSEGQEVDAKIIDIDQEHKRISLSIRALLAPAAEDEEDAE